jgi:uncharacterized protein (DUF1499 family)
MKTNIARIGAALAWVALIVALLCGLTELISGPGYRMSWWPFGTGIVMIRWAATVALGAAVVGLIAALLAGYAGARRNVRTGVVALIAGLVVAAPPVVMWNRVQQLPRIHDVTTDTDNPPAYMAVLLLRQGARNPVQYQASTAAEQKRGYPDLAPVVLPLPPTQAFARAESAARAMGWDIVAVSPEELRIEATDTSLMFGFKDDVVIRVAALADVGTTSSRIDVRSLSRVGGSDFGVNAKRVRAYLAKLASS